MIQLVMNILRLVMGGHDDLRRDLTSSRRIFCDNPITAPANRRSLNPRPDMVRRVTDLNQATVASQPGNGGKGAFHNRFCP